MMSLVNPSLIQIVKKQYVYKLRAYMDLYTRLVLSQIVAILFSLNGLGMMGARGGVFEVSVHFYSADLVVIFSILWAFITAILTTTKAIRNGDFLFVTNRVSSNLSNILFLLTASFIGAATAMMSTYLMKVIIYYFMDHHYVDTQGPMEAPLELLFGIFTTTLYLFLFCALGYLIGVLVQLYKGFIFILPAIFIGTIFLREGNTGLVTSVFKFFFMETSLPIFITKVVITSCLLFICAMGLSNRMEVNQ
ncbi:MAG: hypothetical protein Q8934_19930 [Bacillota bacterium]|nr:hypothetical protein [Bacillota bacterium]